MSSNLTKFIKSINKSKENIIESGELSKSDYVPYVMNLIYSNYNDTLFFVGELNKRPDMPSHIQYNFLLNTIRPRYREYKKINKVQNEETISLIQEYYKYNRRKAEEVSSILTPDQLKVIRERLDKGG